MAIGPGPFAGLGFHQRIEFLFFTLNHMVAVLLFVGKCALLHLTDILAHGGGDHLGDIAVFLDEFGGSGRYGR